MVFVGIATVLNEILPLHWGMGYFDRKLQGLDSFLLRVSCITFLTTELPEIEIQEVLCRINYSLFISFCSQEEEHSLPSHQNTRQALLSHVLGLNSNLVFFPYTKLNLLNVARSFLASLWDVDSYISRSTYSCRTLPRTSPPAQSCYGPHLYYS